MRLTCAVHQRKRQWVSFCWWVRWKDWSISLEANLKGLILARISLPSSNTKIYIFTLSLGLTRIFWGFLLLLQWTQCLCTCPWCNEFIQVDNTTITMTAAPLIKNENGKCWLHVVSCWVHSNKSHTIVSIGPTRSMTPLSDSGDCQWKRNFITHTHQFLQLSNSVSGFPVSSRISIKR